MTGARCRATQFRCVTSFCYFSVQPMQRPDKNVTVGCVLWDKDLHVQSSAICFSQQPQFTCHDIQRILQLAPEPPSISLHGFVRAQAVFGQRKLVLQRGDLASILPDLGPRAMTIAYSALFCVLQCDHRYRKDARPALTHSIYVGRPVRLLICSINEYAVKRLFHREIRSCARSPPPRPPAASAFPRCP